MDILRKPLQARNDGSSDQGSSNGNQRELMDLGTNKEKFYYNV